MMMLMRYCRVFKLLLLNWSNTEMVVTRRSTRALPPNTTLSCVMLCTFLAYMAFWHQVLKEMHDSQIFLQTRGLVLDCCATKLGALVLSCQEKCENVVETAKIKVTSFCEENGIPTEKMVRCRRRMVGKNADDDGISLQAEVRQEQLQIMDKLFEEMKRRSSHMLYVNARFGFLTKLELLMDQGRGHQFDNRPTHYYLRRHLCSRVEEWGPSCATSHQKLRDANRRDGGGLECARLASVGTQVGTRDIVPELARVAEDVLNHVCESGIVRQKLLKTETHQNVPSFNHCTGAAA